MKNLALCLLSLILFVTSFAVNTSAQSNEWLRARGAIPAGAVSGGYEDNERKTFICRVSYRGSFIGGKALDDRCYYNPGNREVSASRFDVLIGTGYSWSRTSRRSKAVAVGGSEEENFYVCRVTTGGGQYPGRTEDGRCYYTRNNRGYSSRTFEILLSSRSGPNLLSASSRGDYREVRDALRDGQAVDQRDKNGRTALMLAAADGYTNVIRELLDERANLDARDKKGDTALILAAGNGRKSVVEQLFRAGADYRIRNNNEENAFVAAAAGGHKDIMEIFLDDRRYGGVEQYDQEVALDRAAYFGRTSVVRLLIGRGLSPNTRGKSSRTPLMQAAAGGRVDTVEYLLGQDVSIFARDDYGYSAFAHAAMADSVKVLRIFLDRELIKKEDVEAGVGIRAAAEKNKRSALKYLLETGVDPDSSDQESGNTALILAAREGHSKAVESLLKFQADIDTQNAEGRNALMEAAGYSKKNTLKILIKSGASLNLKDNDGTTALGLAIRNGHSDTRKELQKAGAAQ